MLNRYADVHIPSSSWAAGTEIHFLFFICKDVWWALGSIGIEGKWTTTPQYTNPHTPVGIPRAHHMVL